jgi:hypothetical protein
MQKIGRFPNRNLTCIPKNTEKYISFDWGKLRFMDSFHFLPESLSQLVENLDKDDNLKFQCLRKQFGEKAELLLRKGVYPYSYMDSWERFEETELPPLECFYSHLTSSGISNEDYQYAQKIWDEFEIKNMGEYHDLYLETDALLLADVFENFRNICIENYKLDPCHYLTAPGLSWDAMLKMTEVNLELLTNIDMHLFIEKGIRGGIASINHRFSKANNAYLQNYDADKPSKYIIDLDANNLYGWAMSQHLPTGKFKWLSEDQISKLDVVNVPNDNAEGYILEVDLEYPSEIHDNHNDYPLAPEKLTITADMLYHTVENITLIILCQAKTN